MHTEISRTQRNRLGFARRLTLALGLLVASAAIFPACTEPRTPEASQTVKCVDYWPESRFRNYAYDHVVHLLSRCRTEVVCLVSTNVNPNNVRVELPAGAEIEVLTYRGSPVREFKPNVRCEFPRIVSRPGDVVASAR